MTRRVVRAVAAVVALGLSGCFWPMPGADANRHSFNSLETAITPASVGALDVVWEASLGAGPAGTPVTSRAGVHINDPATLHTFDARTGAPLWQRTGPDPSVVMRQPYVWRDRVLESRGSGGTAVHVLDARTGAEERRIDNGVIAALRGDEAVQLGWESVCFRLLLCFSFPQVKIIDVATGEVRMSGTRSVNADPDGDVYVTLGDDWFYFSGVAETSGDGVPGQPGVRAYTIPASGARCGSRIAVCPTWQVVPGPDNVPVLGDDGTTLYIGGGDLVALDAATGAEVWRSATPTAEGAPALAEGLLFVGSEDPAIDEFQVFSASGCGAATCEPVWSASLPAVEGETKEILQPAVAGGVVFVAGDGGVLYAFDAAGCGAATCAPLWSHDLGGVITGAPAVSNGRVHVGTADGRLVTFGLPAA